MNEENSALSRLRSLNILIHLLPQHVLSIAPLQIPFLFFSKNKGIKYYSINVNAKFY